MSNDTIARGTTPQEVRIGVDIGGTFNDYVAVRGTDMATWKELGEEPRQAQIAKTIGKYLADTERLGELIHGSTLAINALLEMNATTPALITTAGFEDILDLRRQRRPELFRPWVHHRQPIVPRSLRFGVEERVDANGRVIIPVDAAEAERVIEELPSNVPAVAVCLLHAYANDAHETIIENALKKLRPNVLCVLSSKAFPEIREYERACSVAAEAYLRPIMDQYLTELESAVVPRENQASLWVMQSTGGRLTFETARSYPTRTVMSGPAGGVMAAKSVGRAIGLRNLITFDVGGTSADVALVHDGEPVMAHERTVAGYPLLGASVDVHSIGAGGGSIIHIDEGGLLHVGPQSAGAFPGPACYGLGGSEPTLSDAHVVLGRLPHSYPLAGGLKLDQSAAHKALDYVAVRMGCDVVEAAQAAIAIANASMVNAIRLITVERGQDPRDYILMAYGGAGALHASEVADRLGISSLLIPHRAGVFSAFGTVAAEARLDGSRSIMAAEDAPDTVEESIRELTESMMASFAREVSHAPRVATTVDMKYVGQNWDVSVPVEGDMGAHNLRQSFERRYMAQYGILLDRALEYVTVRVALTGTNGDLATPPTHGDGRVVGTNRVYAAGEWHSASLYVGGIPAEGVPGYAVVCLDETTIYVPGGASLSPVPGGYLLRQGEG